MKKIKKCVACEIEGKDIKATKEADGLDLCDKHYKIYTQLEQILHEKPSN